MECEKEMTYYCERSFGGGENEKHECKSYKKIIIDMQNRFKISSLLLF